MPLKSIYRLGGVFLVLAVVFAPEPERKGDEVENLLFKDFYHLLGFSPETNYQVMKWANPIRYKIIVRNGTPSEKIVDAVHRAMLSFSDYSGVPVTVADSGQIASFKVLFQRPDFDGKLFLSSTGKNALCYAHIDDGLDYHNGISAMMVVLPNNNYDQAIRCLEHELMHAFGFWEHVPVRTEYASSISKGYKSPEERITIADRIWIKALYGPELRPGMGPDEAKPAARRAIARVYREFLAHGNTLVE